MPSSSARVFYAGLVSVTPPVRRPDPPPIGELMRIDVMHPVRVPAGAAGGEERRRRDLLFAIRRWCQLGDPEGADGGSVRWTANLRESQWCAVVHDHASGWACSRVIGNDRA